MKWKVASNVHSVPHETPARACLEKMQRHRIHHLAVTDNDGNFMGICSDRSLVDHALGVGADLSFSFDASEAVDSVHASVEDKTQIREALELLAGSSRSALPVVRDGVVISLVTESDLLAVLRGLIESRDPLDRVVDKGEAVLSTPLVQNLVKFLGDIGI